MPLRCIRFADNKSIQAFQFSTEEWEVLARENRLNNILRMPCCEALVTLKTSKLGTQFFAHRRRGQCVSAPETEEHHKIKEMAYVAAEDCGWSATTEASGRTPTTGEEWIADVLAEKGRAKVAIEIQWSGQTNEETLRRQRRYADSEVRGLWLLRRPGFPITKELPAVCVGGSIEEGFTALIPSLERITAQQRNDPSEWHQAVPLQDFLRAAFDGKFKFGFPEGTKARVTIFATEEDCWRCKAEMKVLTHFSLNYGPWQHKLSLRDISKNEKLKRTCLQHVPTDPSMGSIKYRYSTGVLQRYLSNGCVHCDAPQGEYFIAQLRSQSDPIAEFDIELDANWENLLTSLQYAHEHWSLYQPSSGGFL